MAAPEPDCPRASVPELGALIASILRVALLGNHGMCVHKRTLLAKHLGVLSRHPDAEAYPLLCAVSAHLSGEMRFSVAQAEAQACLAASSERRH